MRNKQSVQMVNDNYDVKHNPKVKELYPTLYEEVVAHDRISVSSWYDLSDEAFEEYQAYRENKDIGYVHTYWSK